MQQPPVLRPGLRVRGSDGIDLGTVEQVLTSPDGQNVQLLLAGGQVRIPAEVIATVGADEVRLKVSADTARTTAWGEAPSGYAEAGSFQGSGAVTEDDDITVRRYEERLNVEKRLTETGAVRVHKSVVEEPQTISVDVTRDEYVVERVPVNRAWRPGDDAPRTEGNTIVIPVVTEKLEVLRRRVVTEELRLTKRQVTEQRQITETVRREVLEVSGPVSGDVTGSAGSSS